MCLCFGCGCLVTLKLYDSLANGGGGGETHTNEILLGYGSRTHKPVSLLNFQNRYSCWMVDIYFKTVRVRPGPALWSAIEEHPEGLGHGHRGYEEGDGSNSNETRNGRVWVKTMNGESDGIAGRGERWR